MPGSGSDAHPHELEPTADAPLNSNAEGKRQAQPNPKMLNFGNLPDVNKRVCKQRKNKNEIKQVSLSALVSSPTKPKPQTAPERTRFGAHGTLTQVALPACHTS